MKKRIYCCLLTLCIVLQFIGVNTPTFAKNVRDEVFTLTIKADTRNVNLAGIVVDVYSAELGHSEPETGYYEYNEDLAFTVTSGKDGKISFIRPSEYFSITVQLDSLPTGYGMDTQTRFFSESEKEFTCTLSKITSVDVIEQDGEFVPVLYSKTGKQLLANTEIKTVSKKLNQNLKGIESTKKEFSFNEKISVSLYGKEYNFNKETVCEYKNELDKAGQLFDKGLISENDYMVALSEYILDDKTEKKSRSQTDDLEFIDGTELYFALKTYCEKQSGKTDKKVKAALEFLEGVPKKDTLTYVISDDAHFRVYYDSNKVKSSVAKVVANEFQTIDELFCGLWGFRRPRKNANTSYYEVYLVSDLGNGILGTANPQNDGSSYIKIVISAAEAIYNHTGGSGYPDALRGILAHEYMHGIMFRYGIFGTNSERTWMHESFADWAGIAYEPSYAPYRKNTVRVFLSHSYEPLDYFTTRGDCQRRHYGACIFPLYIQQECGGVDTIREILLSYLQSNSPLTAINDGLISCGSSLAEAFAGFATFNYSPNHYYKDLPGLYSWKTADIKNVKEYPEDSSVSRAVNRLACHYTEYTPPMNESVLYVTLDFTGTTNTAKIILKAIETYDVLNQDDYDVLIPANRRITIVKTDFCWDNIYAFTIIPINAANTGNVVYTRTARLE